MPVGPNFFEKAADGAREGVFVLSRDRLEYVNPAFERLTGIARDGLGKLGPGFLEHIHPTDRKTLLDWIAPHTDGTPMPAIFRIRGTFPAGGPGRFELRMSVIPGHPGLAIGSIRAVPEHEPDAGSGAAPTECRECRDKILEYLNDADRGIIISRNGRILFVNRRILDFSGYSSDELIGRPFIDFIFKEDRNGIIGPADARRSSGPGNSTYEARFKLAGGRLIFVDIWTRETLFNARPSLLMSVTDISRHKEIENRLAEAVVSTSRALAKIVEHKDPYTAGHQRRVSDLAKAIAGEMGLPDDRLEAVRMAGLLHDLGKVSIPSEILTKPTRLSDTEFKLIMEHPRAAYDILRSIPFSQPVAEIIYQHHERIDGSGYPRGLKDGDILLEARIISVADVVEAMITHRPYRPARKLEDALRELTDNRGKLYDPEVVDACLRLLTEKRFSFQEEQDDPGWDAGRRNDLSRS